MRKAEMKSIGVMMMVMIVLGFAEAELKSDSDGALCRVKCALKCAPQQPYPPIYSKCIADCQSHCNSLSSASDAVNLCITGCDFIKSVAISIGAPDLATNWMNHCLQECKKINNLLQIFSKK
ncbi:unnamed protein product [Sphenostylis stenocarpa]|uniref:Uncharacterized protein n=1 Tax=Sphenostylis stenocarpa TaxID=92480 RepID=A0AA87B8U0_9FABA|nr:unnamed protein product [Sphenostylis stenocarpa]